MQDDQEEEKKTRRSWDLMIGITMILLGSFRLYNRLQEETGWSFRSYLTLTFIIFGGYLIYRHFQTPPKD